MNFFFLLLFFNIISISLASAEGMWISNSELAQLPMSGTAWNNLKSAALGSCPNPDLSNQVSPANVCVLAKALFYARCNLEPSHSQCSSTNLPNFKNEVVNLIMDCIGTEGGRILPLGRELAAYVISADLVGLPSSQDEIFRDWLDDVRYVTLSGRTLISTHENRPNNWGTHAGASRIAADIYLNDHVDLNRAAYVFKGWLGDRDLYSGFEYGDLSWQCVQSEPVGINKKNCLKSGHSMDGVLPDDQRRSGGFTWPPPKENYVYEALQGATVQAELLHRAGYDAWNWEDKAILRAFEWLHTPHFSGNSDFPATGDDTWQPHIVNFRYNTNFPAPVPANCGKNMCWTDWTHQGETLDLVATPTINPNGGTFNISVTVTLLTSTSEATIYYTTDGSIPTTSSTQYSAPFTLTTTTTVKAIAVKSGMQNSNIAQATFTKIIDECIGNVNFDNEVNIFDIIEIIKVYDKTCNDQGFNERADVKEDCVINIFDDIEVIKNFGPC